MQLGDALLVGSPRLRREGGGLAARLEQAEHEAHARGVEQAGVRVLGRRKGGEHVGVAGGLEDQVDVAVGAELVEAAVGAAADPALAGERHARGGRVVVEVVADLDPGHAEKRLEQRAPAVSFTHQRDDVLSVSHSLSPSHDTSYDSWSREPDTLLEVGREACLHR